jgi:hypothetical protein
MSTTNPQFHMMQHMHQMSSMNAPFQNMTVSPFNDMASPFRNQNPFETSLVSIFSSDSFNRQQQMIPPFRTNIPSLPALTSLPDAYQHQNNINQDSRNSPIQLNQETILKLVEELAKVIKSDQPSQVTPTVVPTPVNNQVVVNESTAQNSDNKKNNDQNNSNKNEEIATETRTSRQTDVDGPQQPQERKEDTNTLQTRLQIRNQNQNYQNYANKRRDDYYGTTDYQSRQNQNNNNNNKRFKNNNYGDSSQRNFGYNQNDRNKYYQNNRNNDDRNNRFRNQNQENYNQRRNNSFQRKKEDDDKKPVESKDNELHPNWKNWSENEASLNLDPSNSGWGSYGNSWGDDDQDHSNGTVDLDTNEESFQITLFPQTYQKNHLPSLNLNTTTTTTTTTTATSKPSIHTTSTNTPSNTLPTPTTKPIITPSLSTTSPSSTPTRTTTTTTTPTTTTTTTVPNQSYPIISVNLVQSVDNNTDQRESKESKKNKYEQSTENILDGIDTRELYEVFWNEPPIEQSKFYFFQLKTKSNIASSEKKYWEKHLVPLGVNAVIEKEKSLKENSYIFLIRISIKWRARWLFVLLMCHQMTEKVDFIRDSQQVSDEWSESNQSISETRKLIWKEIQSRAVTQTPIDCRGKLKNKLLEYLRVWKADEVPDGHIFSEEVSAMFVEKQLHDGNYEGYLICFQEDHFMTHPKINFHNSKKKTIHMSLKDIRLEDQQSTSLFCLFKK